MDTCPSKDDINLVKTSWTAVKDSGTTLEEVGMNIFLNMFRRNPEVKSVFNFIQGNETENELKKNANLQKHATGVVRHVDKAVSMLSTGETEKLITILKKLGGRHYGYGAKKEHFEAVGVAILTTLHNGLGDSFTNDVKEAWVNIYGVIATTMAIEMEENI